MKVQFPRRGGLLPSCREPQLTLHPRRLTRAALWSGCPFPSSLETPSWTSPESSAVPAAWCPLGLNQQPPSPEPAKPRYPPVSARRPCVLQFSQAGRRPTTLQPDFVTPAKLAERCECPQPQSKKALRAFLAFYAGAPGADGAADARIPASWKLPRTTLWEPQTNPQTPPF